MTPTEPHAPDSLARPAGVPPELVSAEDAPDAAPLRVGVVGWVLCIINVVFFLLWAGRLFNPDFLEGPLIPCVALALLPGSLCAVIFRSRFCFTLYRVCFAIALIVYLIEKKTLNSEQIFNAMKNWQYVVPGILILGTPILTCAWRWQLLLRGQNIRIGFWALTRLLTASYFFTTFIPGANGGDFFRLFTLAKKDRLSATAVTTSVILDHFLGLPGLMLFVLTGVLWNFNVTGPGDGYASFHYLVKILGLCAVVSLAGFSLLLFGSLYLHSWVSRVEKRLPGGRFLAKTTAALDAYREHPGLILSGAAISLLMHLATLLAFMLFGQATGLQNVAPSQYLFLVFAGLAANYLPLSPGGVGVGELGFETVFSMAPPLFSAENGAHAATMMICYRVAMLFFGAIGGILYVLGRHEIRDAEITGSTSCANS